jgi:hypothetical protein
VAYVCAKRKETGWMDYPIRAGATRGVQCWHLGSESPCMNSAAGGLLLADIVPTQNRAVMLSLAELRPGFINCAPVRPSRESGAFREREGV